MRADGDRIFGPQAIFGAGKIARQIKPAADLFAELKKSSARWRIGGS